MTDVHQKLKERLSESVELMKKHYNKRRKSMEPLNKGELVILNGRNIRAKHRCKKLEDKMLGPFEVLSVGNNARHCKLKLPESWKIHPVFNINLVERYKGIDPKEQVIEVEEDGEVWVMESFIASGPSDSNHEQHVFLVKWKDFSMEENTWETYENVAEHDMRLLENHYEKNPAVGKDGRFGLEGKRKLIWKNKKGGRRS
jgi:hypothetical protein